MGTAVLLTLSIGVIFSGRAQERSRSLAEPADLETVGRSLSEPDVGRTLGEPGETSIPSVLAFVEPDVPTLAAALGRSPAFDRASVIPVNEMRQSEEITLEVCPGVPRPTAEEEILDARIFRIDTTAAVADIRITEFADDETVSRVIQASRSAWESCDDTASEFGGTVARSVLPFFSLAGTPGVNLRSDLINDEASVLSSSQTLAIGHDNLLVEVRVVMVGAPGAGLDPVEILAEVEELL